jgi:hypothetical protein
MAGGTGLLVTGTAVSVAVAVAVGTGVLVGIIAVAVAVDWDVAAVNVGSVMPNVEASPACGVQVTGTVATAVGTTTTAA